MRRRNGNEDGHDNPPVLNGITSAARGGLVKSCFKMLNRSSYSYLRLNYSSLALDETACPSEAKQRRATASCVGLAKSNL